jgi:hypothetical protein
VGSEGGFGDLAGPGRRNFMLSCPFLGIDGVVELIDRLIYFHPIRREEPGQGLDEGSAPVDPMKRPGGCAKGFLGRPEAVPEIY